MVTGSSIHVVRRWLPPFNIGLSIDELEIARTLRVAVTGAVLGSGFVGWESGHATVGVHGDEVQSPVETTRQVRGVDIEGELLAQQLEHLIGAVVLHQIETRSDVFLRRLGDKFQAQRVAAGCDAICGLIVCAFQRAGRSASHIVRANGFVPFVASVVAGVAIDGVNPTPVGINDDLAILFGATPTAGTFLPCQ